MGCCLQTLDWQWMKSKKDLWKTQAASMKHTTEECLKDTRGEYLLATYVTKLTKYKKV